MTEKTSSYRLFLDDYRQPRDCTVYMRNNLYNDEWVVAKDYDEFVQVITERGIPSIVSYDHDLADEHYTPEVYWDDYEKSKEYQEAQKYKEKTGLDCAKFLNEFCRDNDERHPTFLVHSMNPVGADNIKKYLHGKQG